MNTKRKQTLQTAGSPLDKDFLLGLYRSMLRNRAIEERISWLISRGLVYGTAHMGIGEEATSAGTMAALKPQDYVFCTHRGHGQALSKGAEAGKIIAEVLARETGVCGGRGGSMHIADPGVCLYSADGILGANEVICNGFALAIKKQGQTDRIAVVFFGDGTSNEGASWEAMNLASAWKLPTLFVLVNNTYGMSAPLASVVNDTDLQKRAYPFGMPAKSIDGNDVLEVYQTIKEAREYVAAGNGPMLVVENTYRTCGHSKNDNNLYRTKEEIEAWKEKCPIKAFRAYLIEHEIAGEEELEQIAEGVAKEMDAAEEFAKNSPEPSVDTLLDHVYA